MYIYICIYIYISHSEARLVFVVLTRLGRGKPAPSLKRAEL